MIRASTIVVLYIAQTKLYWYYWVYIWNGWYGIDIEDVCWQRQFNLKIEKLIPIANWFSIFIAFFPAYNRRDRKKPRVKFQDRHLNRIQFISHILISQQQIALRSIDLIKMTSIRNEQTINHMYFNSMHTQQCEKINFNQIWFINW